MESIFLKIQNTPVEELNNEDFFEEFERLLKSTIRWSIGARDGNLMYYMRQDIDNDFIEYIKETILALKEDEISLLSNKTNEYLNHHPDFAILNTVDEINDWIKEKQNDINIDLLFQYAIYLIVSSTNKEALKLGLSIIGLLNFDKDPKLVWDLKRVAFCEEFTLYVIVALSNIKDYNDFLFDLAKRLHGWGKLHAIMRLQNTSKAINNWLIKDGIDCSAGSSILAYDILQKTNYLDILDKKKISLDDFINISELFIALLDSPVMEFENIKNNEEILLKYLKHYKVNYMNAESRYAYIIYQINNYIASRVTEDKIPDHPVVKGIFQIVMNDEYVDYIIECINKEDESTFRILMNLISIIHSNKIEDAVWKRFEKNSLEYTYCIGYLLDRFSNKEEIAELICNSFNISKLHKGMGNKYFSSVNKDEQLDEILLFTVQEFRNYPFLCNKLIVAALDSPFIHCRNAALHTIDSWIKLSETLIKDFPGYIYNKLCEIQKTEVLKSYREHINNILGIEEDLSDFKDPDETIWGPIKYTGLYSEKIDSLFEPQIVARGKDYYEQEMVYICEKKDGYFQAFVQGGEPNKTYRVCIDVDNNNDITNMDCTCPYEGFCKHEYATILYIQNNKK